MIDLATMFDEMDADLGAPGSGFPVSGKPEPERQAPVIKKISGISGISGGPKFLAQKQNSEKPQACAQGRGSAREGYIHPHRKCRKSRKSLKI